MASDDVEDEGADGAVAEAAGVEARIAALEADLARVNRMQQHQRAQQLSLHDALIRMHDSLKDQVSVELPETLKPVSFLANGRSDILFLAFAGLNLGVGIPQFEFQRALSQHQAPGYFIKDFHQAWYQQGLLGLTEDLAQTREHLRQLVVGHGARTLVTVGVSTGGYAAILFGCWLGAARVLAFSPQTNVNRRVSARFAQLDTPVDLLRKGETMPDLRAVVAETTEAPEITLIYGASNRYDAFQAQRLEGLDKVRLVAVEGTDSHSMPAELRRRGELDGVLADLLGEQTA
jgi:hypothetical protein